ncbi:hypothetical protein [Cellulomonas sp. NS3]|uniref:hypothetical protein n=1 Tax=Cellulomonas sp. NS3 TaxID=2973977 RepID=UPI0021616352|nr:hypothetical protein [Cellulomonas sp. NS3]
MAASSDAAFDGGRLVCAALDDTMTRSGFAPGQIGTHPGGVGVVFCSEHRAFRDRFPSLAPEIHYAEQGAYTDLNVEVALVGGAHLTEIDLDGCRLERLLGDVDGDDLRPQLTSMTDGPLQDGLQRLDHLLQKVFRRAIAGGESHQ